MLTKKLPLKCDSCQKIYEIEVPDLINSRLHGEEVKKIVDGTNFTSICPYCGEHVFSPYPITYVNDEKQLVVIAGTYESILFRKYVENIDEQYPDYKVIGTHSPIDFHNIVTLIETGYDYHKGMAVILLAGSKKPYKEMKIDDGLDQLRTSVLYLDENKLLRCHLGLGDEDCVSKAKYDTLLKTFDKYNIDIEWNDRNLFVYDQRSIRNILLGNKKDAERNVSLAFTENGNQKHVALITEYLADRLVANQKVSIIDYSSERYHVGNYIKSLLVSNKELLTDGSFLSEIAGPMPIKTKFLIKKVDDSIDNSEILDAYYEIQQKKTKSNSRLMSALKDAMVIFSSDLEFLYKPDEKDFEYCGHSSGKQYIRVWLSKEAAEGHENLFMCKFEDAVRLTVWNCFDGIIINEDSDDIVLNTKFLQDYKHCRIMCSITSMRELIDSLTKDEINYIDEIGLDIIKYAYADGVDCFEKAKQVYGYSHDEVDDILDYSYQKMITIVNYRFDTKKGNDDPVVS